MKRLNIVLLLSVLTLFTGCREYGEKRIVKLVTIDKENVSLYYYDYSSDKPAYLTETAKNNGVEDTLTQLLSENDYDLKLCQFAVCEASIVNENMENLFFALTNSKFSPHISVIIGDTTEESAKYIDYDDSSYTLFTYMVNENNITGIVENPDENTKNVIIDNKLYRQLSSQQSFVLDILGKKLKEGIYAFKYNDKNFSAQLENITVFYSVKDKIMTVNISAILKSYKGMASNEKAKKEFLAILSNQFKKDAADLFSDVKLAQKFNLLWYKNIADFDKVDVKILIN